MRAALALRCSSSALAVSISNEALVKQAVSPAICLCKSFSYNRKGTLNLPDSQRGSRPRGLTRRSLSCHMARRRHIIRHYPMERTCMTKPIAIAAVTLFFCGAGLHAQHPAAVPAPAATAQTERDEYTRYELLAPETASFGILYEVTASTPGAKVYFNPIRKGSAASDEA